MFVGTIFSLILFTMIGYSRTDRVECEVPTKGKFVLESTHQVTPFLGPFVSSVNPDYSARWLGIAGDQTQLITKSESPRGGTIKIVRYEHPISPDNLISICSHVGYFDGHVYALFYSGTPSGVLLNLATKQQQFMTHPSEENFVGFHLGPGKFKLSLSTLIYEQSLFVVPCTNGKGDILSVCPILDVVRFKSNTNGATWEPAEISKKSELFKLGRTWISQPSSNVIYPKLKLIINNGVGKTAYDRCSNAPSSSNEKVAEAKISQCR